MGGISFGVGGIVGVESCGSGVANIVSGDGVTCGSGVAGTAEWAKGPAGIPGVASVACGSTVAGIVDFASGAAGSTGIAGETSGSVVAGVASFASGIDGNAGFAGAKCISGLVRVAAVAGIGGGDATGVTGGDDRAGGSFCSGVAAVACSAFSVGIVCGFGKSCEITCDDLVGIGFAGDVIFEADVEEGFDGVGFGVGVTSFDGIAAGD